MRSPSYLQEDSGTEFMAKKMLAKVSLEELVSVDCKLWFIDLQVSLVHGIVMGGGGAFAVSSKFSVVTEKTVRISRFKTVFPRIFNAIYFLGFCRSRGQHWISHRLQFLIHPPSSSWASW